MELHATQYSLTPRQKRFEVLGDKGRWVKYGLDCQEEQLRAGVSPNDESYGQEKEENHGVYRSEFILVQEFLIGK